MKTPRAFASLSAALLAPLFASATASAQGAPPTPPASPPAASPTTPPAPPPAAPPAAGAADQAADEEAAPKPASAGGAGEPTPAGAADEDVAADEVAEADDEDAARPPGKGKGVVWGVVTDDSSKETIIEAQVTVVGTKKRVLTDVDGKFRVEMPPGTYELRVFYELHTARRVQNIRIEEGKVQRIDVALELDKKAEEEVTAVEVDAERATTANQFMIRRNSTAASDAIGAQEIARSPDRNAADAAKRVVGATVVDARYVYVRGLGERYTNSLLNGAPLPSPEPDKQAVPLDVFPAVLLSDLTVVKTFTPDMPGDFAGGSVVIHTRDFPSKFTFQSTVNAGLNSEVTFASRVAPMNSGKYDFLGFDDGTRALPSGIPGNRLVDLNPETGNRIDLSPYGRALNTPMAVRARPSPPNFGGSLVVGDSLRLGALQNHTLGYQAALSYTRTYLRRAGETIRTFAPATEDGGPLRRLNDYQANTGIERTNWSSFGSASYGYGSNHRLTLTGVYTRNADLEARRIVGFNEERASDVEDTRQRSTTRGMAFGQLRGEHKVPALNRATLTWTGTLAHASLNDPDLRNTIYTFDPQTGARVFEENPLSGLHFYADQKERTLGGNLDWNQPIVEGPTPITAKAGGLLIRRKRSFNARRFVFRRNAAVDPAVYQLPADQLFTDGNIGTALQLEEQTRADDAYDADYDVSSGYLMGDVALHERVRFVGGARVEASDQTIRSFDQFAPTARQISSTLARTDVLPSANVIVKAHNNANLRFSISQTVARPQLRELAPFLFTDYFGGRDIQGNPNLDRTRIINVDARYEWFPGITEVIAFSVFYKKFSKPIEPVILQSSRGIQTFENSKGADNVGAELELRKELGFIAPSSPVMKSFTGLFNLTYVYSRVELNPGGVQTSQERPLAYQSPYILNAAVDYTNDESGTRLRLLYNVFGPRVSQVGAFGLPDVYEQPRNLVDFTAAQKLGDHFDLKLAVENILNAPFRFTHGSEAKDENLVNRYRVGTNAMVFLTFNNN